VSSRLKQVPKLGLGFSAARSGPRTVELAILHLIDFETAAIFGASNAVSGSHFSFLEETQIQLDSVQIELVFAKIEVCFASARFA
jgi:hypothetical protein